MTRLARYRSQTHRAHAGRVHARERRAGHFRQTRFGCVAKDEPHLLAALRYVALNPVRARLVARAEDSRWSSVHAQLDPARGDGLTETAPVLERAPGYAALLRAGEEESLSTALRHHESTGRPIGSSAFMARVEAVLGRDPRPGKRGPKRREMGRWGVEAAGV